MRINVSRSSSSSALQRAQRSGEVYRFFDALDVTLKVSRNIYRIFDPLLRTRGITRTHRSPTWRGSAPRIREIKFLWNVIRLHDFIGWAAGDIESHEYLKIRPARPRVRANFPQIIILLAPIKRTFKRPTRPPRVVATFLAAFKYPTSIYYSHFAAWNFSH